jgi:myo-inositol-1(or 4)-monophosphatase
MVPDDAALARTAAGAAVLAGRYLRSRFRQPAAARVKGHAHDVVTEADAHAEAIIREALQRALPGTQIVGEEGGRHGRGEVCWYVDPIDGTYNFLRGIPLFCVSIGACVAGRYVAGCVYDPVHDELFTATGAGLQLNGEPARRPDKRDTPLVLCDIPTAGVAPIPEESALLRYLMATAADTRRIGSSALSLAYVAVGRADIAANADVYPWDTAAGRLLVTAAGGTFVDAPPVAPASGPGGFVAWGPGWAEPGRQVAALLYTPP